MGVTKWDDPPSRHPGEYLLRLCVLLGLFFAGSKYLTAGPRCDWISTGMSTVLGKWIIAPV